MTKFLLGTIAGCVIVHAATSTAWETNTYQDFIKGTFSGVSLDRNGRLTLAPKLETVLTTGQPVVWSAAQAPDGSVYLGTGHRGRLYRVARDGSSSLIWSADQPEIFAIAVGANGAVYAATSPDGKVYRIVNGKAAELFTPKAKYIWSLAADKDGSLFVGTGEPGNVFRVDPSGAAELFYDTGQAHVTALAIDSSGRVLAGSEPNGLLYRISAKDKAFVLYDANLPEIRSIVPLPDGTVYAAALGGSLANRSGPLTPLIASPGMITAPATSITVTESVDAAPELKNTTATKQITPGVQTPQTTATTIVEIPGVEKSAVYKINADSTVETLWSSKEENVYSLAFQPNGAMYLSTDAQGRIYRIGQDGKPALVVQTNEGEATGLIQGPSGLMAITGDMGKLYRLQEMPAATGTYESPVHDANSIARWGRISWRGTGSVRLQTRSGNSSRPDKTWSDWSDPITDPANSVVKSPNARYIQWRAELTGATADLENISIAYLPQNNPPVVRSVMVSSQASGSTSKASTNTSSTTAAYSITVTDTGEAPATSAGTSTQSLSHAGGSQIVISWQAEDPDSDKMAYSLYFRGEGEHAWKLIRDNMSETSLMLDSDSLADGRYYFRVVASDRPSNAAQYAREGEQVSAPVLIDNTPPVLTLSAPRRLEGHVEVDVDARDQTSPLRRCEYSLDAGPWLPVEAVDGVTDGPHEQFHIALDKLPAGEHLLVIRALDSAGNAGLAKVVLQ